MKFVMKSTDCCQAPPAQADRGRAPAFQSAAFVERPTGFAWRWVWPLVSLFVTACGSPAPVPDQALKAFDQGKIEEGLVQIQAELAKHSRDPELRVAYLTLRERAVNDWLTRARSPTLDDYAAERGRLYRRVLSVDPDNSQARAGLEQIDRDTRVAKMLKDAQIAFDAQDMTTASSKVHAALADDPSNPRARKLLRAILEKTAKPLVDPVLAQALQKTLTIDFKEATVKQVFDVLAKASGINFVLDKDIKTDQRLSLSLKDVSVKDAIGMVALSNQLEQRVAGKNALLIYPNTPAKQKDYEELSVRTFFLANADAEQVAATLKTILKLRDVVVDKAQSAVLIRDTPSALQMAEKVVAIEDLPTPETMIEVEVMEINRDRLMNLGIQFPASLTLTPLASTSGGTVTLSDLKHLHLGSVGATLPSMVINANDTDSDLKTLANPRIRVRNRETAKILIGDRVPNITSTATSTGFVSENIQYLDVGLKVELTPTITIDNEVAIKVSLEVSSIAKTITTSAGSTAYQLGTRSASTVLRLKDGENQILAGLISRQDSRTANKVPGLGDVPGAGHLFGTETADRSGNEIVLSITPRLVRNTPRPDADLLQFESGTDSSLHGPDDAAPVISTVAPARAMPPSSGASRPATASDAASTSGSGAQGSSGSSTGLAWSGATTATVGAAIQEQLMLNTSQPVSSVSLTIGYDPAVLQVTQVLEGTLLKIDGTPTTFTQHADASTGQLRVASVRASTATTGASGQGSVVILNLMPLAASNASSLRLISAVATAPDGSTVDLPLPTPQSVSVSTKTSAQ